jgi:hypothetical protein
VSQLSVAGSPGDRRQSVRCHWTDRGSNHRQYEAAGSAAGVLRATCVPGVDETPALPSGEIPDRGPYQAPCGPDSHDFDKIGLGCLLILASQEFRPPKS